MAVIVDYRLPVLIPSEGYYDRYEISNSRLGNVKRLMSGDTFIPKGNYFEFGSLVDSLITQPHMMFVPSDKLSDEDILRAYKMRDMAFSDPIFGPFIKASVKQTAYINTLNMCHEDGQHFCVEARCLMDFYVPGLNVISDLKTTVATTQKAWDKSFRDHAYYRQAAWYMDIMQADHFLFFAISKKEPFEIFQTKVVRDDYWYELGKVEYIDLCRALCKAYDGAPGYEYLLAA